MFKKINGKDWMLDAEVAHVALVEERPASAWGFQGLAYIKL